MSDKLFMMLTIRRKFSTMKAMLGKVKKMSKIRRSAEDRARMKYLQKDKMSRKIKGTKLKTKLFRTIKLAPIETVLLSKMMIEVIIMVQIQCYHSIIKYLMCISKTCIAQKSHKNSLSTI